MSIKRAADFIRCVALDMIDKANSGHQGIVLGMADVMTVLWSRHLRYQKGHSSRDRFVLSAGHGSALLYSTLFSIGEISKKELGTFRQIHSNLPGHPEKSDIVEMTTGPLGQGIAWAVGMAKAETLLEENYNTYVIASDGDLMEGISHEACSLAGKWKLNKLIVLWDDNEITIDGSTELSRDDHVVLMFQSYGWNVIEINGNDIPEIDHAIENAKSNDRPTFIRCKTTIGYGSKYANDERVHGKVLNSEDIQDVKKHFDMHYEDFTMPDDIEKFWGNVIQENRDFFAHKSNKITDKKVYSCDKKIHHELEKDISTREASGIILSDLAEKYNEIVFGSADLGISTNTKINQNYISFGVREHGMCAISGGMTLSGLKACCATFLVFTDYARPVLRLAALMKVPLITIATHDSLALGEDGPTHQPIEQLDSLRLIPGLNVFRPCNGLEVLWSWEQALNNEEPSVLALSRQKLKYIPNSYNKIRSAYIIQKHNNKLKMTLVATGSEVPLACEVAEYFENSGIGVNVVSVVSTDLFDKESDKYKKEVFGSEYIVFIEASTANIWYKYAKNHSLIIGLNDFGMSGKGSDVMDHFGFSSDKIIKKIHKSFPAL